MKRKAKRKPVKKSAPATIPIQNDHWKQDFRSTTFSTKFVLHLSEPMIEMICAIADGVQWDRSDFIPGMPDNFIATQNALVKRGLIVRKLEDERRRVLEKATKANAPRHEYSYYELTPAGDAVVNLFKVTGVFVEADAAINKKARKRS